MLDSLGLQAGDEPVPEVPGQDFVGLGRVLRGGELLVTVEPSQGDDGQPSSWLVLRVPSIAVGVPGVAENMMLNPMPTGTIVINIPTS